jgi:hypothetical protein
LNVVVLLEDGEEGGEGSLLLLEASEEDLVDVELHNRCQSGHERATALPFSSPLQGLNFLNFLNFLNLLNLLKQHRNSQWQLHWQPLRTKGVQVACLPGQCLQAEHHQEAMTVAMSHLMPLLAHLPLVLVAWFQVQAINMRSSRTTNNQFCKSERWER